MFTGIIQTVGRVRTLERGGGSLRLAVEARITGTPLAPGESIAVDGICLTVARRTARGFEADLGAETLSRTTAGSWKGGRRVNLERAMAAGDRFGGHLVQGHVDDVGRVLALTRARGQTTLRVLYPARIGPLVADKGSITIDGVSLTVCRLTETWFEVALIPHTLAATNLAERKPQEAVNLEVDLIARHLARLLEAREGDPGPRRGRARRGARKVRSGS